jgi:hypothetical protein
VLCRWIRIPHRFCCKEYLKSSSGRVPHFSRCLPGAPFLALFARSGALRRHPTRPQPALRRFLLPPTDEHWREPGLIVSCKSKSPTSRKEREKWGTQAPKSDFEYVLEPQPVLRRFLLPPTDEHWRELGLIVSCKSKAPLLAKNARNGAPTHPSLILKGFLNLSQRSADFYPRQRMNIGASLGLS